MVDDGLEGGVGDGESGRDGAGEVDGEFENGFGGVLSSILSKVMRMLGEFMKAKHRSARIDQARHDVA